jgi:hypothetical protein
VVPVEERPLRAAYTAVQIWALAPVVVFDAYIRSLSQPATSSVEFGTGVVPTRSNSRFGKSSNFSTAFTQKKSDPVTNNLDRGNRKLTLERCATSSK